MKIVSFFISFFHILQFFHSCFSEVSSLNQYLVFISPSFHSTLKLKSIFSHHFILFCLLRIFIMFYHQVELLNDNAPHLPAPLLLHTHLIFLRKFVDPYFFSLFPNNLGNAIKKCIQNTHNSVIFLKRIIIKTNN